MSKNCIHCLIAGRVQGVWFRDSTAKQAKQIGVVGWVRNLRDGRVEVMVAGEAEKVEKMYQWLQRGPTIARVDECFREDVPWQDFPDFTVRLDGAV